MRKHQEIRPKSHSNFVPRKGGDGGAAPTIKFKDYLGVKFANSRPVMNCVPPTEIIKLVPTAAVSDRAHDKKDGAYLRTSWISVRGRAKLDQAVVSKPRLYASVYMTGTDEAGNPVSFETVIEETERKRCQLEGKTEAWQGSQPDESEVCMYVRAALELVDTQDPERAKGIKRRLVPRASLTRSEREADKAAEKWAANHGVDITVSGMCRT